jgi:Putative zinc-finger
VAEVGDHPDPNLLGAFLEKSLTQPERVRFLDHLSQCKNCREILSLTAAQPSAVDAVSVVAVRTGWLSPRVLRWGAVMACVVVVGAVVTFRQQHATRPFEPSIVQGNPTAESELRFSVAAPKPADGNASAEGAPNAALKAAPVEMSDARAGSQLAEMVRGKAKDPAQEAEARIPTGSMAAPAAVSNAQIVPLVSTKLMPRWTLTSDGTLQRSRDAGRTWQTVAVPSKTILRALAANGLDIWVGGAAGALFHSSDAGQHWIQIRPIVNGEALVADIIGVEFADPLHGKLTLADSQTQSLNPSQHKDRALQRYDFQPDSTGDVEVQKTPGPTVFGTESWTTADAGQTWQKQ